LIASRRGLVVAVLAALFWAGALSNQGAAMSWSPGPGSFAPPAPAVPGREEPLARIVCPPGYQASVHASGLRSPHGLAFAPDGGLYVAEEIAGRVSRIDPNGEITTALDGLVRPQGVDVDPQGNLYVTEDVQGGRVLRLEPGGRQTVLAADRAAPEGIIWAPEGDFYITESNVQFSATPPWDFVTGVTRISPEDQVTTVLTSTLLWSYSAIALDATGQLYVANEASSVGTFDSIFRLDPNTGTRTLFASDLVFPEGLAFSPGGRFPLYVTEEDLGDGQGRLSVVQPDGTHMPLCTGFGTLEGVALDSRGNIYVSEDANGLVIRIASPAGAAPGPPLEPSADPPGWAAGNSFALSWQNPPHPHPMAGAYLKLGTPPTHSTDGQFYAGKDLDTIPGIPVSGPGGQPAYLWLLDTAGNADPSSAVSATLYYDPLPPVSFAQAPFPAQEAPIRVGWVATDTHSGLASVSLRVKGGESDSWVDSGLSVSPGGPAFFLYPPAGKGVYAFATVATDRAGNVEEPPTGSGDALTHCTTWQRAYLPLVWKASP
jgi:sugar lactone lactonase YvrE